MEMTAALLVFRIERKKVDKGHIAVFVALNQDFFGDGKFAVSPSVDT
jgi:hypothetical protein